MFDDDKLNDLYERYVDDIDTDTANTIISRVSELESTIREMSFVIECLISILKKNKEE